MTKDDIHQQWLRQHGLIAVLSNLCIGPNSLPVRHAAKEGVSNVSDSGWILRSGDESPEYADNPKNYSLVPLDRLIATDKSLEILYDQPVGTELTRKDTEEPWRWIIDNQVVDEDGRVIAIL
ncbi:DUF2185 domain-containing protein [Verrucomicrobium sp. BvORR106]|uniref:immunity protein Imm33 domain-containing protein n=1 Tax=Verrucomicrobium sp. BvORR106 TaxID=1403819 RepID=UPI00056E8B30|nr:DUF2185 domain-containing protein [Verrucomicrobium sp. BvORR106]